MALAKMDTDYKRLASANGPLMKATFGSSKVSDIDKHMTVLHLGIKYRNEAFCTRGVVKSQHTHTHTHTHRHRDTLTHTHIHPHTQSRVYGFTVKSHATHNNTISIKTMAKSHRLRFAQDGPRPLKTSRHGCSQ